MNKTSVYVTLFSSVLRLLTLRELLRSTTPLKASRSVQVVSCLPSRVVHESNRITGVMRKAPKYKAQNLLVLRFVRLLSGGYKRMTEFIPFATQRYREREGLRQRS